MSQGKNYRTMVTVSIDVATLERFDAWRGKIPRGMTIGLLLDAAEALKARVSEERRVEMGIQR